jgi:predicted Ser/Thr protein kinase
MPADALIDDLLDRWEERQRCSQPVDPEELRDWCQDSPGLLPELERRIGVLEQFGRGQAPTTTGADDGTDAIPNAPDVPGFELLALVGHGGMGVVYRARHAKLDRTVALKLVWAGRPAKPTDIARFRIESEAAAGLDHPNIVPLFEVGEHAGQHYLAMKFIDGPSLAKLARGAAKAEVTRLEAIARAVDFAHRQGILHRDIKPSNILTDAAGTPYVTDFGLAKRIGAEQSLTESGQMLGTAGYIAPEQALGKKGLTVTADVFSLGAVLFERLTGSPAFPGGTILERLRSLHDLPTPRPTVLMPTLPRDLETVCLKCLERDPTKRYATAGALADDLARWLRGEPIVARRVTQVERFWLWCRRNPAVARLSAALGIALAGGTISLWTLAIQHRQALATLVIKENEVTAQARQAAAQTSATRAARLEFAVSLLSNVGIRRGDRYPMERWALFDLAKLNVDLKSIFIEQALSNPELAERFSFSDAWAVQAAIGASEGRRSAALRLVNARMQDPTVDEHVRFSASLLALRLGAADIELPEWSGDGSLVSGQEGPWFIQVEQLSRAQIIRLVPNWLQLLERSRNKDVIVWAAQGLAAASLIAPDGDGILRSASDHFVDMLIKGPDDNVVTVAANGLAGLGPRLHGPGANRACDALVAALEKAVVDNQWPIVLAAARGLVALTPWLDGPAAVRVFDCLLAALGKAATANQWPTVQSATFVLAASAARLDGPAVTRACDGLIAMLGRATAENKWPAAQAAGEGLAALAPRLEGQAAVRACDGLVATLNKAVAENQWPVARATGGELAALAPRLWGPAALRACDGLIAMVSKAAAANQWAAVQAGEHGLGALATQLDGPAVVRAWDGVAGVLGEARIDASSRRYEPVAAELAALAGRLDGPAAVRASNRLVALLDKASETHQWDAVQSLGQGLAVLAPRLDGPAAGRAWEGMVTALGRLLDQQGLFGVEGVAEGLAALAPRLEGPAVPQAWDDLARVLGKARQNNWSGVFRPAAAGFAALAPRLNGPAASRAGDSLTTALVKAAVDYEWQTVPAAAAGLEALAPRLDGAAIDRARDALTDVLDKTAAQNMWGDVHGAVVEGLAALAPRMDPIDVRHTFDAVFRLIEGGDDIPASDAARAAAMVLSGQMEATDRLVCRARIGKAAVARLRRMRDENQLTEMWESLCFIIDQFEPTIERNIALGEHSFGDIAIWAGEHVIVVNGKITIKPSLFTATTDLATIADCLRHPACVGETRQMVLHRLEELAFPPGPTATRQQTMPVLVSGMVEPTAAAIVIAGQTALETKWERERKFRTTWDAVEWLHKNHPEIDLDKPYTPRK